MTKKLDRPDSYSRASAVHPDSRFNPRARHDLEAERDRLGARLKAEVEFVTAAS